MNSGNDVIRLLAIVGTLLVVGPALAAVFVSALADAVGAVGTSTFLLAILVAAILIIWSLARGRKTG